MSATVEDLKLDFSDLESKYKTTLDESYENYVVVDGTPKAPAAKIPVLEKVLRKALSSATEIISMHMPTDEKGNTMGYVFVECKDEDGAKALIRNFHNKKFDKAHTFFMDKLSSVGKLAQLSQQELTTFTEPEIEEFKPNPHFKSWLTDSQGREQAAVHIGEVVSVQWLRKGGNMKPAFSRDQMTDSYIKWSPLGTYLLTLHREGAALHAGAEFDLIARFPHRDVCFVDFSPNENYLVTGSRTPITAPPEDQRKNWPFKATDEGNNIVLWDTRTFLPLRTFPVSPLSLLATKPIEDNDPWISSTTSPLFKSLVETERKKNVWPPFKWSADSKYFARISAKDTLSIYETPSAALSGKKSLKVPGIRDFEFAPTLINNKQLLAYWTPEMQNQTARVCLIDVATKVTVRNRSLFNVAGCKIYWQNEGNYMCVKVDRYSKNKKNVFSSLEIWRLNDKDVGVDVVDLKEVVTSLAWEPFSDRIACYLYADVTGNPISPSKNILAFFVPERKKKKDGTWKEAYRFEARQTNTFVWNPRGRFLTTILKGSPKALLEFWDCDTDGPAIECAGVSPNVGKLQHKDTSKDLPINLRLLGSKDESFEITDAEWDPSGRQLATWNSMGNGGSPGYRLWDIGGGLERVETKNDKFKAFLWRPRPASILTSEHRDEIRKNFKTLSEEFDLEDKMRENEDSEELQRKRTDAITNWAAFRAKSIPSLLAAGIHPATYRFEIVDGKRVLMRKEIISYSEKQI